MTQSVLYDEDILLWSEQQADLIRKLGQTRHDLPNEFDVENVAEEIESVGRSELAAVESLLRQLLLHLIKVSVERESEAVGHWRGEIVAIHYEMRRRYAQSMRQRIDLDDLWRSAREQLLPSYKNEQEQLLLRLPEQCPFKLDSLVVDRLDRDGLIEALRRLSASNGGTQA